MSSAALLGALSIGVGFLKGRQQANKYRGMFRQKQIENDLKQQELNLKQQELNSRIIKLANNYSTNLKDGRKKKTIELEREVNAGIELLNSNMPTAFKRRVLEDIAPSFSSDFKNMINNTPDDKLGSFSSGLFALSNVPGIRDEQKQIVPGKFRPLFNKFVSAWNKMGLPVDIARAEGKNFVKEDKQYNKEKMQIASSPPERQVTFNEKDGRKYYEQWDGVNNKWVQTKAAEEKNTVRAASNRGKFLAGQKHAVSIINDMMSAYEDSGDPGAINDINKIKKKAFREISRLIEDGYDSSSSAVIALELARDKIKSEKPKRIGEASKYDFESHGHD